MTRPGSTGTSIAAGDFDGDGDLDVVVADQTEERLSWHENLDGRGTVFAAHTITSSSAQLRVAGSVSAVDMDGDGRVDILAGGRSYLSWFRNLGGGAFSSRLIIGQTYGILVLAADIDADGFPDAVSVDASSNLAWYRNLNGTGEFDGRLVISSDVRSIQSIQPATNADGHTDLFVVSGTSAPVSAWWLRNVNGTGFTWATVSTASASVSAAALALADVTNNGHPDIMAFISRSRMTALLGRRGSIELPFANVVSSFATLLPTRDFDGDGLSDVMATLTNPERTVSLFFHPDSSTPGVLVAGTQSGDDLWIQLAADMTTATLDPEHGGLPGLLMATKSGHADTSYRVLWLENHLGPPPEPPTLGSDSVRITRSVASTVELAVHDSRLVTVVWSLQKVCTSAHGMAPAAVWNHAHDAGRVAQREAGVLSSPGERIHVDPPDQGTTSCVFVSLVDWFGRRSAVLKHAFTSEHDARLLAQPPAASCDDPSVPPLFPPHQRLPLPSVISTELSNTSTILSMRCNRLQHKLYKPTWFTFTPPTCGVLHAQSVSASSVLVVAAFPLDSCSQVVNTTEFDPACSEGELHIEISEPVAVVVGLAEDGLEAAVQLLVEFDATGCFEVRSLGSDPGAILLGVGDADSDGQADLLTRLPSLAVQLIGSTNDYAAEESAGFEVTTFEAAVLGDVTGNGADDFVWTDRQSVQVTVYWARNGGGTGTDWVTPSPITSSIVANAGVYELFIADVDANGHNDIVATAGASFLWLPSEGNGVFSAPATLLETSDSSLRFRDVHVGDVTGDGFVDIVRSTTTLIVLNRHNGSGAAYRDDEVLSSLRPLYVTLLDWDGDGDVDVVFAYQSSESATRDHVFVQWVENYGNGTLGAARPVHERLWFDGSHSTDVRAIQLADYDGDQDLDVILLAYSITSSDDRHSVLVARNLDGGGDFGSFETVASTTSDTMVIVDIGADGDADILFPDTFELRINRNGTKHTHPPALLSRQVELRFVSSVVAMFHITLVDSGYWDVQDAALPAPTVSQLTEEHSGQFDGGSLLVLPALGASTDNVLYAIKMDGLGRRSSVLRVPFSTLASAADATLHSINFVFEAAFSPVAVEHVFAVPLWVNDSSSVATCAPNATMLLFMPNVAPRVISSGEQFVPVNDTTNVWSFTVQVTSADAASRLNYTFTFERYSLLLSPEEVFFNPTRETNALRINRWPNSALKFLRLTQVLRSGDSLTPASVLLTGSLQANLTSVVTSWSGTDRTVFVVKNAAAFKAYFALQQTDIVVQWDGDLWVDVEHGDVSLVVDDVQQWSVGFDLLAAWADDVRERSHSIVRQGTAGWASSGLLMSSLPNAFEPWKYGHSSAVGVWASASSVEASETLLSNNSQHVVCRDTDSAAGCGFGAEWLSPTVLQVLDPLPGTHVAAFDAPRMTSMATGDLDQDGDVDIIVPSYSSLYQVGLFWYENVDGEGNTWRQRTLHGSTACAFVLVADVTRDSLPDIVCGTTSGTTQIVLLESQPPNPGDPVAFAEPRELLSLSGSTSASAIVLLEDADNDGDLDLISADGPQGAFVIENVDGNGTVWQYHWSGLNTVTYAFADLNGDNLPDMIGRLQSTAAVGWYASIDGHGPFDTTGTLIFQDSPSFTRYPSAAVALDMDADGDNDVVVGGHDYHTPPQKQLVWYENLDGAGTFGGGAVLTEAAYRPYRFVLAPGGFFVQHDSKISWVPLPDSIGTVTTPQLVVQAGGSISISIGDMDGDGDADVAVASFWDNSVKWFENRPGGYAAAPRLARPLLGNLNSSGPAFVAEPVLWGTSGIVYEQQGGEWATAAVWDGPRAVPRLWVVGSFFSASTLDDIVVIGNGSALLAGFTNNGSNVFAEVVLSGIAGSAADVLDVARWRRRTPVLDGLLVLSESHPTELRLYQSDGNDFVSSVVLLNGGSVLTAMTTLEDESQVLVTDADGFLAWLSVDVHTLAVTELLRVDVLAGLRDMVSAYDGTISAVRVGDLTNSGLVDVAFVWDQLYLITNVPSATSSAVGYAELVEFDSATSAVAVPISLFIADVNDDGLLDLGASDRVYLSTPSPFSRARSLAGRPSRSGVHVADMNGDGGKDVVVVFADGEGSAVHWFSNDGRGAFADSEAIIVTPFVVGRLTLGDVDGDGRVDVIMRGTGAGLGWYRNLGDLQFSEPHIISSSGGAASIRAVDLDGDGDMDVLMAEGSSPVWFENLDGVGTFGPKITLQAATPLTEVVAGDVTGDGLPDVFTGYNQASGNVRYYRSLGGGDFSAPQLVSSQLQSVRRIVLADVDGDGDLDAVATFSSGLLGWFENEDGLGTFAAVRVISWALNLPERVVAADFDADGAVDLAVISANSGYIAWYQNLGRSTDEAELVRWSPQKIIAELSSSASFKVADLDGDELLDVVISTFTPGGVSWYANEFVVSPDSSSSITCDLSEIPIVPSITSETVCTFMSRREGELLLTDTSTVFVSVDPPEANASPLSPSRGSVFTFRLSSSVPGTYVVGSDLVDEPFGVRFVTTPPSIVPGSLRVVSGSASSSQGRVQARGTTFLRVALDVEFLGTTPSGVLVTYGPISRPDAFTCGSVSLSGTALSGTVTCSTEGQERLANVVPLFFRVVVFGVESEVDEDSSLLLQPAPQVFQVLGCARFNNDTGAAIDCPLEGAIAVTMIGELFGVNGSTSVMVGSQLCQILEIRSPRNLTCRLPSSDGGTQLVAAFTIRPDGNSTVIYGTPRPLVSYSVPFVLGLRGCSSMLSERLELRGCERSGGPSGEITIIGANFGKVESGLRVTVGGKPCVALQEVDVSDDVYAQNATAGVAVSGLRCRLPSGVLTKQPLLVVDLSGRASNSPAFVSYAQCAPGTRNNMTLCSPCAAGRFADESGMDECLACKPGRFTNVTGRSECADCPPGRVVPSAGARECVLCVRGQHQPPSSRTACALCGAGRFSAEDGSTACSPCDTGHVSQGVGNFECRACEPGRFQGAGHQECQACEVGQFSSVEAGVSCEACPVGSVAPARGTEVCVVCPAGSFQSASRSECPLCELGRFAERNSSTECRACPTGRVASRLGSVACAECSPGRFQSANFDQCRECSPGRFSNDSGQASCEGCPRNSFAEGAGQVRCKQCPPLQATGLGTGHTECIPCAVGKYPTFLDGRRPGDPDRVLRECVSCPPNTDCDGSGTVVAQSGSWVVALNSGEVQAYVCLPSRCVSCPQSSENSSQPQLSRSCCAKNRADGAENPVCGRCADGFVEWGGDCLECDGVNWPVVVALMLVMWVVVLFMHGSLNQQSNSLALVFFYYVQIALLLFGEETEWLAWAAFFNFNPMQSTGSCVAPWSPVRKMVVSALSPLLTWVFLAMTAAIHAVQHRYLRKIGQGGTWHEFAAPYWRSCIAFFLFTFNNVAATSLRFFECLDVADGRWRVVRSSPDIDCESAEYKAAVTFFVACLGFVVASPVLVALFLRRRSIRALVDDPDMRAVRLRGSSVAVGTNESSGDVETRMQVFGILFEMYRGTSGDVTYYWNAVVLVRRVVVIATSVVALKYGHAVRYAALTIVSALVLVLHMHFMPFRDMTSEGEFVDGPEHRAALLARDKTLIPLNYVEMIGLLLLTCFSASLAAVSLPLSEKQALRFSVSVFSWLGVLMLLILWRLSQRAKAKRKRRRAKASTSSSVALPGRASVAGADVEASTSKVVMLDLAWEESGSVSGRGKGEVQMESISRRE